MHACRTLLQSPLQLSTRVSVGEEVLTPLSSANPRPAHPRIHLPRRIVLSYALRVPME